MIELRERYGFKFTKSLGQNFLKDKNVIDKIVEATDITDQDLVIEIGPGFGVITAEAAEKAKKVIAIELDKDLIPILRDTLKDYDNVEIINQDVLKTDINGLIREAGCDKARIIGNLPYYITTPIIMGMLETDLIAESITVMMQKEVADRINAKPGSKLYGQLSVTVQYYCTTDMVTTVPKEAFFPEPQVDSAIMRLNIRKEKPVELIDESMLFRCAKAGFGQRRKTLMNSLMGLGNITKEEIGNCLADLGIDSRRRAETLSLEEFAAIANYLSSKGEQKEVTINEGSSEIK
jgi:dimethyladenosine transferase